ncbi:MAG: type IV pilus secretin PilQ [Caldimicrobium sp.]|nr:type IV pilus secretin PilQ [Caldimicrobium sp.]MCX7872830.1 type IV pilus secretin PilQ [Caldimicrobium sp.]MDW8093591.1 type IV pilus secretin PilQ [Caldimicrobium sp.]
MMKYKYVFIINYIFVLFTLLFHINKLYAGKNILITAYYIDKPSEKLIFEFTSKPEYEVSKEDKKLTIKFPRVTIKTTDWLKTFPKDLFQEFNVLYEKEKLIIEIITLKDFNFKATTYENKLFIDLLWEKETKPVMAVVKGTQITTSPMDIIELPKYHLPFTTSPAPLQLPFTKRYVGPPISVDFQEADLHAVFRVLAEVGNINIVVSDKVKGNITLKVKQVPWDLILDVILANYGLGMMSLGNVMRIAPLEEIKTESDKYKDYLTSLKDIQEKGPLTTKTFQLKYIKGDTIVSKIKEIIAGDGKITFEPHSNMLIIKDTEKNLAEIEKIIREIDKPTKQVLIEARIVEIQDTYAHRLGIRWGGTAYRGTEHTLLGIGRGTTKSPGSVSYTYPGGYGPGSSNVTISIPAGALVDLGVAGSTNIGFIFGHIGRSVLLLDAELSAMETQGIARVFARPKILTLDHQDAEIKQGYKIPYLQLNQYGVATTQFIDAVLRLKVTPHVTPDNRLNLDVEIEKSTPDWSRVVQGVPALLTRYAKTRVLINSGDTLVIGGIKTKDLGENLDQVPGLSRIPSLGELFKKKERVSEKTELMVFITPRIVSVEIPGIDY